MKSSRPENKLGKLQQSGILPQLCLYDLVKYNLPLKVFISVTFEQNKDALSFIWVRLTRFNLTPRFVLHVTF